MALLWDGTRVPVTLIGGILGSGKTTLLNRLLADAGGRRLVVLVNDVGDLAIDATLISSVRDDVIELTNGCVCCSMTDGLGEALETIRQSPLPPDHVLVELSGVAEPHRVAPWASTPGFRLDAIVVCVDAERIGHQLADRWLADTVRAQLRAADLIVLTKTDLVDRPPSLLGHTTAPVLDGRSLGLEAILQAEPIGVPVEFDEHLGTSRWTVSSIRLPDPIDPERFADRLADLPVELVRLKGFVSSGDQAWIVQGVGERRTLLPIGADIAGGADRWGLVAIATPDLTLAALDDALAALAT